MGYHYLDNQGYEHIQRFIGGLSEWEERGNLLEVALVS